MTDFKYFAFISYNSHDTMWGKRLQKKLEGYKIPSTLCNEHGWNRKPINPVFFAPTDIQPGGLTEELKDRLKSSRNLVVICSPNSARSEWVGREIAFFHCLGRTKQIHFFIVEGEPHSNNSDTECFNPIVNKLGLPEILGANVHEKIYRWPWLNKERAYVQLISKLLEVEFDSIWKRHKRQLIKKSIISFVCACLIFFSIWYTWQANQPIDVSIALKEATMLNKHLPPLQDAIVTLTLNNEKKTETIPNIESMASFPNIPQHFLGETVGLQIRCKDYINMDTTLVLSKFITVRLKRDEKIYGDVKFRLWDPYSERAIPNTEIFIEGHTVYSDENGLVSLHIPIDEQRPFYKIRAALHFENDSIFMPCGTDDVLIVEP